MSVHGWVSPLSVVLVVIAACGQTREVGAPCAGEDTLSGGACKGSALVSCREFTWHEDLCRGPRGCLDERCDQSVAERGDSCGAAGALACAVDGKELLRCDAGAMVVARECRGARGCYREGDAPPTCDVGQPEVGDACEASGFRCGPSGKMVIACGSHQYSVRNNCLGDKGCFTFSPSVLAEQRRKKECTAGFLACDPSVGEVGEPCGGAPQWGRPCLPADRCPPGTTRTEASYSRDGWAFCSKDGKEELGCKDGRLIAVRSCTSCSVQWEADEERYTVDCTQGRTHQKSGGGVVGVFRPEES
jgi:hypothetical protein